MTAKRIYSINSKLYCYKSQRGSRFGGASCINTERAREQMSKRERKEVCLPLSSLVDLTLHLYNNQVIKHGGNVKGNYA